MSASYDVYSDWEQYNGRTVRLDDMDCVIRVRVYDGYYPIKCRMIDVSAEPTGEAKRSAFYKGMKSRLGDDWSTDVLSSDIDVQVNILQQLGS